MVEIITLNMLNLGFLSLNSLRIMLWACDENINLKIDNIFSDIKIFWISNTTLWHHTFLIITCDD